MAVLDEPIKEAAELKNYIDGEWVDSKSDDYWDVVNPATQKVVAKVPMSTEEEVKSAIETAQEAFPEWRRTPPLARVRCLFRLKELLEAHFAANEVVGAPPRGRQIPVP